MKLFNQKYMKIYLSHSSKYNYQNELYLPLKQSKLNSLHEINYFLEDDTPENVKNSKQVIKESDLIIAEISIKSIAIGMELGWADAFGKPIILIYKQGVPISKYMGILTEDIIEYSDPQDLISKLETCLLKS